MLKVSAFVLHYQQPLDASYSNAKVLLKSFVRRGRDFLEKVRNAGPVRSGDALPRKVAVSPTVVCSKAAAVSSASLRKSVAAAWNNLVRAYTAGNASGGFASQFARSYRPRSGFASWQHVDGYRGLARKVAMLGFVGVAVSSGRGSQPDISGDGNFHISTIRVSALVLKVTGKDYCIGTASKVSKFCEIRIV